MALLARILDSRFDDLAPLVRASHAGCGTLLMAGRAEVTRGTGVLARIIAAAFRFPAASTDVAVCVAKWPDGTGEVWERQFGDRVFRSQLGQRGALLTEAFGPFVFDVALPVEGGALVWTAVAGRCLGVPLPRGLLPSADAREWAEDERFQFDVSIRAPLGGGLVVRYRGWLAAAQGGG